MFRALILENPIKKWQVQMKTPTRSYTTVVSGTYSGPIDDSTETTDQKLRQSKQVKHIPRYIISNENPDNNRYLVSINKRLSGKIEMRPIATSEKETDSST